MLDKISKIIYQQCEIQSGELLLVGISGGADSLFLLHALHQFGYPIVAMYVNHHLRPESDHEAQIVNQFADDLRVKFITCQADVHGYAINHSISIEEAARISRYRLLFDQAKICGAKAVAVGHNADDQAETILMHLLRGSGLSGLSGMSFRVLPNPWSDDIPLIRPLLSTWRMEIQEYLEENNLHPVIDQSNQDISIFRNRLRHELLPILESYNPSIRKVFLRMGQSLRDDYLLMQQLTDVAWEKVLVEQGEGFLAFKTAGFLDQPLPIQRYLLRKAINYHLPGLRDVDFDCIERGLSVLANENNRSQADLLGGLSLLKEADRFWIATWQADIQGYDLPAMAVGESTPITVPSVHQLVNGWQLTSEMIQNFNLDDIQSEASLDPFQAWLDLDALELPLIVRTRRPGDRIMSLGMNGHSIKLSDLMINLKVPYKRRDTWPLICSGEEVVWVPGYRISHTARLTQATTIVIHLRLSKLNTT